MVRIQSEYYDDVPTHALIEISRAQAARIRKMRDAVRANHAYCMETFDHTPDYKVPAEDWDNDEEVIPLLKDWDSSWECSTLHVTDNRFYWRALIKHTEVWMETDTIDIEEIRWL